MRRRRYYLCLNWYYFYFSFRESTLTRSPSPWMGGCWLDGFLLVELPWAYAVVRAVLLRRQWILVDLVFLLTLTVRTNFVSLMICRVPVQPDMSEDANRLRWHHGPAQGVESGLQQVWLLRWDYSLQRWAKERECAYLPYLGDFHRVCRAFTSWKW